ncbi:MAG: NUMOD4 domain-containing protein [Aminipila sp.]
MIDIEIWKSIDGFPDYKVSSNGRVKNRKNRILSLSATGAGYMKVGISKDGHQFTCLVHRLVAKAFIRNEECLPEVNHIDENKANNNITNLEWCDRTYNNNFGSRARYTKAVIGIELETGAVVKYANAHQAAHRGFSCSAILECAKGKRKTHKGFIWEFVEG